MVSLNQFRHINSNSENYNKMFALKLLLIFFHLGATDILFEPANMIDIEVDTLNDHECMGHLISILRHMSEKEMYPIPRTEEERRHAKLPGWMQSLKSKLMDPRTENNIKLFLLRLILNCNEIFEPFARYFLVDILSVITTENLWPADSILNYFFIDVAVMLLSWSETTHVLPNQSLMEKCFASNLFEKMIKWLDHPRREITNYLLDVIRIMVELWGSFIVVEYSLVHKLFSRSSITQESTLIQSER